MQRINRFCEKSPWAGIELPHATRLEVDPATHSQWSHPWNPCCGHWANGPRVEDKSAELGVWPAWVAVKLLQAPGKVQNCCWYQYQCLHQSEQLLEALGSICEVEESSHAKTEWVATPLTSYEASLVIVVQHGWLKAPSLHRIRMPYHQGLQQPIENPWYSTWRNIGKRFESIWEGTCMKRKSVIIDSVASNIVTCLNYLVQKGERKQTCEINMIKIKIAASVESATTGLLLHLSIQLRHWWCFSRSDSDTANKNCPLPRTLLWTLTRYNWRMDPAHFVAWPSWILTSW